MRSVQLRGYNAYPIIETAQSGNILIVFKGEKEMKQQFNEKNPTPKGKDSPKEALRQARKQKQAQRWS